MTLEPRRTKSAAVDNTNARYAALAVHELSYVAPAHTPLWSWLAEVPPMDRHHFQRVLINPVFDAAPKLTRWYMPWQYQRAAQIARRTELCYLFGEACTVGMMPHLKHGNSRPVWLSVGHTQDGPWSQQRIDTLARALQQCDAVTFFTREEMDVYIPRYGLDREKCHYIPIHTDETGGYDYLMEASPEDQPFLLSMGSPNREFTSLARICREIDIPLVIITRPWHENDSLEELAQLGAKIITNANKRVALSYLKFAEATVMVFQDPSIAGGYTTMMHAMFLRTPMIANDALGVAEHVIDGESGYVTKYGDDVALREAIRQLWTDHDLRRRFADRSFDLGMNNHSLEAAAQRFDDLTLQLLSD